MGRHRTLAVDQEESASFARVLRQRVVATILLAEVQSLVGDQLARVALSVLVYEMTGSAPATAATYAATLLPAIFGGVVVARIGDRVSRRGVMIRCDVFQALCFAVMVVPGVPIGVLIFLVVIAVVAGPVFSAAEVSYLASALSGEDFRAANGLRMVGTQAAQVGGFVFGGLLVTTIGARPTLALDAASFAISALLVASTRRRGPVPADLAPMAAETVTTTGVRHPWRDRDVRTLSLLALLVGFFVVPEGLAVPLADQVGVRTWQVGVLLAAGALGGALGAVFLVRWVRPTARLRVAGWMAVGAGVPLMLAALTTTWQLTALAWFVSGFLAAFVVEVTSTAVRAVPDERRSAYVGTLGALLLAAQGVCLVAFGALVHWWSPTAVIAVAGASGSLLAVVVGWRLLQAPGRLVTRPVVAQHAPVR